MELIDLFDEFGNRIGLTVERGSKLAPGWYTMGVHAYIVNRKGEFLISKRAPEKSFPNMWEGPGGAVISGETGLRAAVREVREEIGVVLDPRESELFKRITVDGVIYEHWIFRSDVDIKEVKLQPGETSDAVWAPKSLISRLINEKNFVAGEIAEEIFEYLGIR